jgi:hypothetical protein
MPRAFVDRQGPCQWPAGGPHCWQVKVPTWFEVNEREPADVGLLQQARQLDGGDPRHVGTLGVGFGDDLLPKLVTDIHRR